MWPCPPPPCPPVQYQPLPISTGNVGIDRCGNIAVYAAPNTVHRQVCWPQNGWPIPAQLPWWPWYGGRGWGGTLGGLAEVLKAGAPMAEWMAAARAATGQKR